MSLILDGTSGITTPMYNGGIASNPVTPSVNMKNRIINGAMVIDQRNAGASVTPTDGQYTLDRWTFYLSQASKLTAQQSSTAPAGFINSLLITSRSAYSVGSGEQFTLTQCIEGFNCTDLAWGTSDAKTVTLSFWVRSSLTGTFGGSLRNSATNRSYPFTYTISSANTWEQKSVTIAGDITGTWLTNNNIGIYVGFSLGAGSTVIGTSGTWAAANYKGATGQTNLVGTNGATFYITGVQLEVGSTASSFDYRPYTTEMQLCQRYYTKFVTDGDVYTNFATGGLNSTTNAILQTTFPTKMRASPTISASNTRIYDMVSTYATTTIALSRSSTTSFTAEFTISGGTSGRVCLLSANNNTAGYVDASAEL